MRIEVKKLTGLRFSPMTRFDLHEEFGLACLVEDKGEVTLYFNDSICRTWANEEHPNTWGVKWFDANHVVLYLDGPQIATVSAATWEQHELGYLSELYISPNFMVAAYGEEQFYSSCPGELESHQVAFFFATDRSHSESVTLWRRTAIPGDWTTSLRAIPMKIILFSSGGIAQCCGC